MFDLDVSSERWKHLQKLIEKPHEHADGMNECHICDEPVVEVVIRWIERWSWFEQNRLQCWPEIDRVTKDLKGWVVSGRVGNKYLQVTRPTLNEAIQNMREKSENKP